MSLPLTTDVAQALFEWDDLLFRISRAIRHAQDMANLLDSVGLQRRASQASSIHADLTNLLITGELIPRLRAVIVERHPVLTDPAAAELLRQLTAVSVPLNFSEPPRSSMNYLTSSYEKFVEAWQAALGVDQED